MLTNDHVIDQQRTKEVWNVMLPVRKRYVADLVGKDTMGDFALLKIRDVSDLPYVPLGDSDALLPGRLVVALGNPYSHAFRTAEPTVTFGIVSANHRNQFTYSDAIQTDAPLNPGNSGGPLINLDGELVGINGRVRVRFGEKYNTGVGLAIPTNQIRRFLPLLKKGDVFHGHISGLVFGPAPDGSISMTLRDVRADSAADKAGFKAGDEVLSVDGLPAWNYFRFWGILHAYPEGAEVAIGVRRGEEEETLKATLVRWYPRGSDEPDEPQEKPGLGAVLVDAVATLGAEVKQVLPNSGASRAGLRPGDIILAFEGRQIMGTKDLENMISGVYREREAGTRRTLTVRLKIQRGLDEKEIEVTLGPEPE
jgi:serine protease Do